MPVVAQADPPRPHACISTVNGDNVNVRYGVTERIIGPPGCREAFAGEKWVRAVPPWVVANAAKIDEFKSNFRAASYVIDEGTAQAKTFTVGQEILRTECFNSDGTSTACKDALGRLFIVPLSPVFNPLSVGKHTTTLYMDMKARTCTGLGSTGEVAPPGLSVGCLEMDKHPYPIADADNVNMTVSSQPPPTPNS
jgi:hypothetical protein